MWVAFVAPTQYVPFSIDIEKFYLQIFLDIGFFFRQAKILWNNLIVFVFDLRNLHWNLEYRTIYRVHQKKKRNEKIYHWNILNQRISLKLKHNFSLVYLKQLLKVSYWSFKYFKRYQDFYIQYLNLTCFNKGINWRQ